MRPRLLAALLLGLACGPAASADPCGMVPPVFTGNGPAIERIGAQKTYVFYKDGVESFVIRPGFKGQVEDFGMLIPFPSPPAIRKVGDDVFAHVAAAVDPPVIDAIPPRPQAAMAFGGAPGGRRGGRARDKGVTVLKQEAVGMYEVAVLEAGSPAALARWMTEHGYRYPQGMDGVCGEYVAAGWCFVAVKTRVGRKDRTDPQPGQTARPDSGLEPGETFDGHVQAMGFRFQSDELVVPMRLSAFNEGQLRNIVYVLADQGLKIDDMPAALVRRQIPGGELLENVSEPLPLGVPGWALGRNRGQPWPEDAEKQARERVKEALQQGWIQRQRDPAPHNRLARDLFAGDLLAAKLRRLSHPHEELEKRLLGVGEALQLRGPALDALHQAELAKLRAEVVEQALADLQDMVLTVIDGDFEREVLAQQNLTFSDFELAAKQNSRREYDARQAQKPRRLPERFVFRAAEGEEPRLIAKPEGVK